MKAFVSTQSPRFAFMIDTEAVLTLTVAHLSVDVS